MIVVSNRLPVHLNKTDNGYETLKSVSGLATAFDSVLDWVRRFKEAIEGV